MTLDYKEFGDEWKEEIMSFRKSDIVELLRDTCIKLAKITPKVIPYCDVCENGTVRLPSFQFDLYKYCPWCSRKLPHV